MDAITKIQLKQLIQPRLDHVLGLWNACVENDEPDDEGVQEAYDQLVGDTQCLLRWLGLELAEIEDLGLEFPGDGTDVFTSFVINDVFRWVEVDAVEV